MTDPSEQIGAALHTVLDSFVAVCGAPDDTDVAQRADDALAELDALLEAPGDD